MIHFRSIKTKLSVIFVLLFVAVELAEILSIIALFGHSFYIQKRNTMLEAYDDINDDSILNKDVLQDTISVMEDYEATSGLYFCIMKDQGKTVIYSTNDSVAENSAFARVDDPSVFDNNKGPEKVDGYNSNQWMVMYRTIKTDQGDLDVIIWTCIEATASAAISGLIPLMTAISAALLVLVIFVSLYITDRIVKPIKQVDQVAMDISGHDYKVRVPAPKSRDEVYRLSVSINHMADQLESDMTELEEKNAQLEQDIREKSRIDKMRVDLFSNISHELKTPLAVISSYAEMLKYEGENIDRDEYLDVIMEESKDMSRLIRNLLDLSHLEHQTQNMEMERSCISDMTQSLLDTRRILFEQRHISLISDIEPDLYASADESFLSSAFDNYLSNAVKYTTDEMITYVTLQGTENSIIYRVENTAAHFDQEEMDSIWDSFYRGDKSHKKDEYSSMGLGLYIVKTITAAHHGTCSVQNTSRGVMFSIEIPRIS